MQRLRLSDVREAVRTVTNLNSTDARIADYVNRAQERLLYRGKWVGTYGRFRVCIASGCITLPREIETLEAAAICKRPATIRGEWFEFLPAGPGILGDRDNIGDQLTDRGEACCFDDPIGTGKKLAVYCDKTEATGAAINIQYWDSNGRWVRTSWEDEWIDGENIALTPKGTFLPSQYYVNTNGLVRVSKPVTNGTVKIFEYNVAAGTYRLLANYAHDEEVPVYRRYLFPNISGQTGESCDAVAIDIAGKARFIKCRNDEDFLMIGHVEAIRLAVQAVKKEEDNLHDEAGKCMDQAVVELGFQLLHYKGDGEVQPITFTSSDVTGPAVSNII